MKCAIQIIVGCLVFIAAQCQPNNRTKFPFVMTVQGGIMDGQTDKAVPQFQLLGGIKKDAWIVSLGAGIDYYGPKRSVPLFVDVKNFIGKDDKAFFSYGSLGYNVSWLRTSQQIKNWWTNLNDESGGIFYEAGLGYKFALKSKMAFGLSAGYSYKAQSETVQYRSICDFCVPPIVEEPPKPEIYKYQFRRVSIKLHCWF
jgi:hypothetical protein